MLPDSLPPRDWSASGSSWTHGVRDWQLTIQEPVAIELEDMPRQVSRSLAGLAFLTEMHLEPASAPESARRLAAQAANAIAKAAHGAVVDEQVGTLVLPRGVKRYSPESESSVELLTMSWWWTGAGLTNLESLRRFLELLDEHVPEALPRRYGFYEPPEFKLEEQGRAHLVEFLHEAGSEFVIVYPTLPALGLTLNLQDEPGQGPHGFVTHHLQVDFDRSVLSQPGWEVALKRFWRATSLLLKPFYGDVRTLSGYERRGSRLWVPPGAEDHPVDGPFWAGLPSGPAHALVVGTPYLELWSYMSEGSLGEPRFVSAEQWSRAADVLGLIGGVPEELADVRGLQGSGEGLTLQSVVPWPPRVWPFGC